MKLSPEDEKTALKLFEYIRDDVKGTRQQVAGLDKKVDEVKDCVHKLETKTVTKQECAAHHTKVEGRISTLTAEVAKKQTRDAVPAVGTSGQYRTPSQWGIPAAEGETTKHSKSWFYKAKDNLALIITLFTFLGLMGTAFYYAAHTMVKVERAVKSDNDKQLKELKKKLQQINNTREIKHTYQYQTPDAAVKKRRRRGRR
jgi:hypothetical protein